MTLNPFTAAAGLALVLAFGLFARLNSQYSGFRKVVNESLATSEGYDAKFIDMVTNLEEVLTTRASFPYPGGKDPMTGRRREVATMALTPEPRRHSAKAKTITAPFQPMPETTFNEPPSDKVRLTAIIADDYGQHTAIVMDGERSQSVDVGDAVGTRRVTRITGKELTMENDSTVFTYGLSGSRTQLRK